MFWDFFDKLTSIAIIKNIKLAFPVVKKLPELFIGNISTKNIRRNGVIKFLLKSKTDVKQYFKIVKGKNIVSGKAKALNGYCILFIGKSYSVKMAMDKLGEMNFNN